MQAHVWLLLLAFAPGTAGAQTLYKCVQGTAVTYSSTACETLGLKSGGEIRDRVTTLPLSSAAQRAPAQTQKPGSVQGKDNEIDLPKASTTKPVNPLVEKLAK